MKLFKAIKEGRVEDVRRLLDAGADPNAKHGILTEPAIALAVEAESPQLVRLLARAGADVDAEDYGGNAAIHEAARSGKPDLVRALIEVGADLNKPDGASQWTALMWATWYSCPQAGTPLRPGFHEIVRELLAAGADPDRRARDGETALWFAAHLDRREIGETLLAAGADPSAGSKGDSAVANAASTGHGEFVRLLVRAMPAMPAPSHDGALLRAALLGDADAVRARLGAGDDPDSREPGSGRRLLELAAPLGFADVVGLLLDAGAPPDAKKDAEAPLAAAARLGHTDTALRLLAAGANPNVEDSRHFLALMRAAKHGDAALARALVAAGAKLEAKTRFEEWPALLVAASEGHEEVVRLLLDAGANVNALKGRALSAAAGSGNPRVVEILVAGGIDVKPEGKDALLTAVEAGSASVARALLAAGVDPNAKNDYRESALIVAARKGHAEVVDLLLGAKAKIDARSEGYTALHWAALEGHAAVASRLVAAGLGPDIKGALARAVAAGDLDGVREALAAGETVDVADKAAKWTPLLWAAALGYAEIARALLGAGANPTARGNFPFTPLQAAARNGHSEIVAALIDAGAVTKKDTRDAVLALVAAAELGRDESVRLLLGAGVDPNARERDKTVLMTAVEGCHAGVVRLLLDAGADAGTKDTMGITAADVAEARERPDIAAMLVAARGAKAATTAKSAKSAKAAEPAESAKKLLDRKLRDAVAAGDADGIRTWLSKGADPNQTDDRGSSLLLLTVMKWGAEPALALLDAGADPNAAGPAPILSTAAERGLTEVVRRLLAAGADPGARGHRGRGPLVGAIYRDHLDVVELLIAAGADVGAVDDVNWSPLTYAANHGRREVAAALLRAGAVGRLDRDGAKTVLVHAAHTHLADVARAVVEAFAPSTARLAPLAAIARGDVEGLRRLIAGGLSLDAKDPLAKRPLLAWAALLGTVDIVRELLAAGADVNVKAGRLTPLAIAYERGDAAVVELLLAAGADVDAKADSSPQVSLIAHAVDRGDAAFVHRLLAEGAKPSFTALHIAIRTRNEEFARLLVEAGAPLDTRDFFDRTLVIWASMNEQPRVARLMLERGANPNGKYDRTPALSWAVVTANREAIDALLGAGASPDAPDEDRNAPLHHAARMGDVEVTRALLAAGATVSARNKAGRTPLMEAARLGQAEIVEALLGAGADLAGKDKGRMTAVDLAAAEGEEAVVRALTKSDAGARRDWLGDLARLFDGTLPEAKLKARQKVVQDELMTGLRDAFLARLPASRVVALEGEFGLYYGLPREHADEKNRNAVWMNATNLPAARLEELLAALGFAHLGDLACEKLGDVAVRLFADATHSDAYAALNVGLLGQQSFDFVSRLADGSFVTTTTAEAPAFPERRLFPFAYPGAGPRVLLHKHRRRLAACHEAGIAHTPAEASLEAAARWVDEFLLRRLGEWT
jgi:ankyrin repeat protein